MLRFWKGAIENGEKGSFWSFGLSSLSGLFGQEEQAIDNGQWAMGKNGLSGHLVVWSIKTGKGG
jgi:hypothetical protein